METNHCPTCHAPIPANAPGGFCPACLLRDAEEPPTDGRSAPPLEEIAAAFPHLEVIGLIGQGGMGVVYKVRQPSLDRFVALKILAPEMGRDPAFAERFAREARTLGKLHHPNIVTVFEHGEKDGFFYLLMEYVDGVNLRQAMRAGRFSPDQALAIVPGICDALQAAHAQGIWHRDIKPENILLDREGKVKIADFGIARIVGDPQRDFTLTRTGSALGSVSYMAPEQHEKPHDVDHRADIYSLGVVIYEMLTGELPLGRFPSPSQRAAVDARIDEIVLKTLEKERELRQQSATEVKTDVHRAMQPGGSQKSQPVPPVASKASGMAKLGSGLLLAGLAGLPFLPEFGVLAILLAFVLGLMTWRERLGKFVTTGSAVMLVFCVLWALFMSIGGVRNGEPKTTITRIEEPEKSPVGLSNPPAIDPAVEGVFRKAVTAANESNEAEFLNCIRGDLDGPGKVMTPLECMQLFVGEIVKLNTSAVEGYNYLPETIYRGRLTRTAVASDDLWNPVVYSTIRRSSGLLENLIVEFHYEDNRWVGTTRLPPIYRSFSRVEFKPKSGDAAGVLKTHLGSYKVFQAVKGNPDVFDILGTGKEAESAKDLADLRIRDLRKSLEKFGMDSALKVISPAVKPEAPWMAEEAPPFQAPKP
jgi:serine/threonine protein kinase